MATVTEKTELSLLEKYVQPKSLTFWAALIPLIAGALLYVAAAMPGVLDPVVALINVVYPNADPGILINAGLGMIGIKGSITAATVAANRSATPSQG